MEEFIVQIVAVLMERPLFTIALFALMIIIIWRVEVAQRKIDKILDETKEDR